MRIRIINLKATGMKTSGKQSIYKYSARSCKYKWRNGLELEIGS